MQIALLTYSTKPRGSVVHTLELATALHHAGHSVSVFALDKDNKGFGRSLPCTYHPIPANPAPSDIDRLIQQRIQEFIKGLSTHLQTQTYDIFHAQDCISANALAELRQQGFLQSFVRTVHHIEAYNSPYLRSCQDRSIYEPDLCLCVSDYWQQQLFMSYQIAAPKVTNGVNRDRFTSVKSPRDTVIKQQLGITGAPIFLTVGGIEPRKNTLQLAKAFAQARTSLPNTQLVIAGGATLFDYQAYRDEFFVLLKHLKLTVGESILLPGVLADDDLSSLYRSADTFIFPSVKEGWGLVVLEAIASGLPTIVSHQAPFTEFLTPEQTLFVQPDDPTAIAQAMLASLQPGVAKSLQQHSQSLLETYSWSASAALHLQHYQTLLRP
jgi:glycosyltransferase-like protein